MENMGFEEWWAWWRENIAKPAGISMGSKGVAMRSWKHRENEGVIADVLVATENYKQYKPFFRYTPMHATTFISDRSRGWEGHMETHTGKSEGTKQYNVYDPALAHIGYELAGEKPPGTAKRVSAERGVPCNGTEQEK